MQKFEGPSVPHPPRTFFDWNLKKSFLMARHVSHHEDDSMRTKPSPFRVRPAETSFKVAIRDPIDKESLHWGRGGKFGVFHL